MTAAVLPLPSSQQEASPNKGSCRSRKAKASHDDTRHELEKALEERWGVPPASLRPFVG